MFRRKKRTLKVVLLMKEMVLEVIITITKRVLLVKIPKLKVKPGHPMSGRWTTSCLVLCTFCVRCSLSVGQ